MPCDKNTYVTTTYIFCLHIKYEMDSPILLLMSTKFGMVAGYKMVVASETR